MLNLPLRVNGHLGETGEVSPSLRGTPLPLGAHQIGTGVNFALFSRHATSVRLDLFDRPDDATPKRSIALDPDFNRTGDVWHVWVDGIRPGQLYGYRVDGPYAPQEGYRFNPHKLLVDPFATALSGFDGHDFVAAYGYDPDSPHADLSYSCQDDAATMPKGVVAHDNFNWRRDQPLRRPWTETVIYELHVRGFTIHPSAVVRQPGTYRGLIEKIPYLRDLGITAVELMPVQEFNENHPPRTDPRTGTRLTNFWGYDPVSFFAVKASYASAPGLGEQKLEFQEMVRAFHREGIEVILDVVFNHTAEGSELGPTLSFRGLDNAVYYLLAPDPRFYRDFTGCGNTINAGHPVVRDLILDALRYWVVETHVDGFRFDLASVLGRDEAGRLQADSPFLDRIAEDPILRDAKLIAEAWDAAGAYQVGSFSERRWAEWNGKYRDEVRRFWRGDPGMLGLLASRLGGSSDLYQQSGKGPDSSINFVTAHDGFTLNDLVSYAHKHNEANGEDNRDGTDENDSANYGEEGDTIDSTIEAVRARQIKNFFLTLLVSRGVPMLLGGDEFRRTQRGNNNAYCQDNEISWVDWRLLDQHHDLHRFVRGLLAFRRAQPVLRRDSFYADAEVAWRVPDGSAPDWNAPDAKELGWLVHGGEGDSDLFIMFNAGDAAARFALPEAPAGHAWRRAADTSLPSPDDLTDEGAEVGLPDPRSYLVGPRASAILVAR